MDKLIKFDDRPLEPDLICSKDGDVLKRSERETVRAYNELFSSCIPHVLGMFGRRWR